MPQKDEKMMPGAQNTQKSKENFLGGPTPEGAEDLISDMEAEGGKTQEMGMTENSVSIPVSVAPDLAGAKPGEQIDVRLTATVSGQEGDNINLNVSKAVRMSGPEAPGSAPGPAVRGPGMGMGRNANAPEIMSPEVSKA